MQKFRLDWNYHSNHLEGNSLTYGETKAPIRINIPAIVDSIRTGKFLQAVNQDTEQAVLAEKPEGEKAVHVSGQHPKRVKSELYRQDLAVVRVH